MKGMGRVSDVIQLLLLASLWALDCGLQHSGCLNNSRQIERVFSVPGDAVMLVSTPPSVFNLSAEPHNVTWYRVHSEQPISNQSGRVLVLGETLWLLNVSLADAGDYETVVRSPGQCFRQQTQLVVDLLQPQCSRPRTARQSLIKGVTDLLSCPLGNHIRRLHSYGVPHSISWYKGCEQISDGADRFHYWDSSLKVEGVQSADQGLYTCTLHFHLGGAKGRVSETIDAEVQGDHYRLPQIREPANDVVRAELGSKMTKHCLVFVPCEGRPLLDVDLYWKREEEYISDEPSHRLHMTEERRELQEGGVLIDRWLIISELREEDLNLNYTCQVLSSRKTVSSYFTVLPKDPDLLIPVSLLIGCCLLLFLLCVSVFSVFKLELVLWFRRTFPMLYSSSDMKLYDAYVAYPQRGSPGWTDEVERFALDTLPRVLEEACGYSLFIPERDSLPGEAVMDSVEENLKSSRRIILLYTTSTFSNKYCSNNNNTLLSRPWDQADTEHHSHSSEERLETSKEDLKTSMEHLKTSTKEHLNTTKEHLNTNINTSKEHSIISEDHRLFHKDLLNSSVSSRPSEDLVSDIQLLSRPSEDLVSERPQSCEHPCGPSRTQLECVTAMHRALLERSLKVILVELEELGPSDLEQLPESVRHLRQSQGAVCWRRTPGTRWRAGCMRRTGGDTETALSSCLSPDCTFWKQVRYRMPVRAKRPRGPPEATALLQLQRTQRLHSVPV